MSKVKNQESRLQAVLYESQEGGVLIFDLYFWLFYFEYSLSVAREASRHGGIVSERLPAFGGSDGNTERIPTSACPGK